MYPVNSCSPIRLKTEAPIAQLLGLKEYKRRVAKNNYVHYWFSRLVHIFLAMQCKEDFFKMAFFAVSTTKDGEKPAEIRTDNWWHQLKAFTKEQPNVLLEQIQCRSKQFPKGNLDSTWNRLQESERAVLLKSVRRKKNVYIIPLRFPETSNPKIQTGNTPRLFFPLFLSACCPCVVHPTSNGCNLPCSHACRLQTND